MVTQCALRPIPRDLARYYNHDIYNIVELEELALQHYAAVSGKNYTSDQNLRQSLEAVIIPAYTRFEVLVGQIKPSTDPVQKLHSLYRKAAALRLHGFHTILSAVDSKDPSLMRHANAMLSRTQELLDQWQMSLTHLASEYGLTIYH